MGKTKRKITTVKDGYRFTIKPLDEGVMAQWDSGYKMAFNTLDAFFDELANDMREAIEPALLVKDDKFVRQLDVDIAIVMTKSP